MTTYNTGNPIGSADPKDLYDNAEALDRAINDSAATFTDRLGNERPTLKRLETDYPLAGVYADEAAISAENAHLAQTGAVAAKDGAVVAKTAAEAARDATVVGAAPTVYATTAAGLAATTSGKYFSVPSADSSEYLILYLNSSGTAVEQKRYQSSSGVSGVAAAYTNTADDPKRNTFNVDEAVDGFVINSSTGATAAFTGYWSTGYVPVVPGGTIKLNRKIFGNVSVPCGYAFYSASKAYISGSTTAAAADTSISVPSNAMYFRAGFLSSESSMAGAMVVNGDTLPTKYSTFAAIKLSDFKDEFATSARLYVDDNLNLFNPNAIKAGYGLYVGNEFANASFFITDYIPVVQGGTVTCSLSNGYAADYGGVFYDFNKRKLSRAGQTLANTPETVPAGAAFVRFMFDNTTAVKGSLMIVQGSTLPTSYKPFGIKAAAPGRQWAGKGFAVMGDSISSYAASGRWKDDVCANLSMVKRVDAGVSGRQMSQALTGLSSSNFTNVDLAVIFLGTNDFTGITLGSYSDTSAAATFYGYTRNNIETLLTWKPTMRLVFFTPLKRFDGATNPAGKTLLDYVNAIQQVCADYALPVLDLQRMSGLNSLNASVYTTDNLHPNDAGQIACISNPATRFFESL